MADIQQGLQGQFNDLLPEKLAKKTLTSDCDSHKYGMYCQHLESGV